MAELTLSEPFRSLKNSCETRCVAGCCGTDAFEVESRNIIGWIRENGVPRALLALNQLEEMIQAVHGQSGPITSGVDSFDLYWGESAECIDFLELFQRETLTALLTFNRPSALNVDWLTANQCAVRDLTLAIDETQDFERLPILADALEEAGCSDHRILNHCRHSRMHPRKCWVVELILMGLRMDPPPRSRTVPLQNRVTPRGDIISADVRGTLMGNRGRLHDDKQQIRRNFVGKNWILCQLNFRGRRREIMKPGLYTELFFLDEATGLAAGHRPCGECQNSRYKSFREAWIRGNPDLLIDGKISAKQLDEALHSERLNDDRTKRADEESLVDLPAGVIVLRSGNDRPFLVVEDVLRPWDASGYAAAIPRPSDERVRVLTPRSIVNAIRAGFTVQFHSSATSE